MLNQLWFQNKKDSFNSSSQLLKEIRIEAFELPEPVDGGREVRRLDETEAVAAAVAERFVAAVRELRRR